MLLIAGPAVSAAAQAGPRGARRARWLAISTAPAMHTPVEVTEKALRLLTRVDADCLVAIGGGSTTGLSKALALRTELPQVVLPTTYAGSEVTPVLGPDRGRSQDHPHLARRAAGDGHLRRRAEHGTCRWTRRSPAGSTRWRTRSRRCTRRRPTRSPTCSRWTRSRASPPRCRAIAAGAGRPGRAGRTAAGAWLAGTCLGSVGMGLAPQARAHRSAARSACRTRRRTPCCCRTPWPTTPLAAPEAMRRIADALGVPDAPAGVFDLIASLPGADLAARARSGRAGSAQGRRRSPRRGPTRTHARSPRSA